MGYLAANSPYRRFVMSWLARMSRTHRATALVVCVVAAVALVVAVIWPFTDLIAAHDVGTITGPSRAFHLQAAREAVRTQLLTLGAGLFAAGALVYTARNFTLSRRQLELTEQGQVSDRYAKGIEQLGFGELDVRIGAIYALERVTRDSPRDHPTVMEVLAAFIREHSREQWPPVTSEQPQTERTMRPDVQAALTVIGRRITKYDKWRIDLQGADLAAARLVDADLSNIDLTRADLTGANLNSSYMENTWFAHSKLCNAFLRDAKLKIVLSMQADLTDAHLDRAELIGVDLTDAKLIDADFTDAKLTRVDLTDADLTGTHLPGNIPIPEGWLRDPGSGALTRAGDESGDAIH